MMAAATQRRMNPEDCDPKRFPYVMHSTSNTGGTTTTTTTTNAATGLAAKQRHRSLHPNHSRNLSHSYHGAPRQWQEPFPRPASANPTLDHRHEPAHAPRPTRSRSRLQKRPSQHMLKKSASVSAMSHTVPPARRPSLDPRDGTALARLPDHAVPQRSSSLRKKSLGPVDRPRSKRGPSDEPKSTASTTHAPLSLRPKSPPTEQSPQADSDSEKSSRAGSPGSPGRPNPIRTARYQPLAPNDPSPLNPLYHIPSSYFSPVHTPDTPQPATSPNPHISTEKNENAALLPPGFKPGKSEHTEVEEIVRPAVTHEVVRRDTKEMVQDEITREIHVHHYYTYTQPVKAVEVLPARHFLVDAETGKKVEIPAPEGWVMPRNLQPHKPDLSGISPVARHYVVDEEHPTGATEPAPVHVNKKASHQDLKPTRKPSTGNWTPFPKVR